MKDIAQTVIAAAGGILTYLFGPWDAVIIALLAAVCLDYATGVASAAATHTLSSKVGFQGLLKKIVIFLMVGLAGVLDNLLVNTNGALRAAVCLFYIVNEGLSILENAARLGLPLPEALRSALGQLSEKK